MAPCSLDCADELEVALAGARKQVENAQLPIHVTVIDALDWVLRDVLGEPVGEEHK